MKAFNLQARLSLSLSPSALASGHLVDGDRGRGLGGAHHNSSNHGAWLQLSAAHSVYESRLAIGAGLGGLGSRRMGAAQSGTRNAVPQEQSLQVPRHAVHFDPSQL